MEAVQQINNIEYENDPVDLDGLITEICAIFTANYKELDTYEKYFKMVFKRVASWTSESINNFGKQSKDGKQAVKLYIRKLLLSTLNKPHYNDTLNRFYDPYAVLCGVYAGLMVQYDPVNLNSMLKVKNIFCSLGLSENELIKHFETHGHVIYKKYMINRVINESDDAREFGEPPLIQLTDKERNALYDYLRERVN